MMAFYKMYYIRHHRTDFTRIQLRLWEFMYPEYVEERHRRAEAAMKHLSIISNAISQAYNGFYIQK